MIIANFERGNEPISLCGLYQYNYGEILRIQGLNLPTATEMHFSLYERGGESVTRIGTTKDGVTDVLIPDSMLENDNISIDYNIYAFVYSTDETSGWTEHKMCMRVKSRPKPEAFDRPEDAKIFREAIKVVNDAAGRAAAAEDNAKSYADQAAGDAAQTGKDREAIKEMVNMVSGIDEQVEAVKKYSQKAESAASEASTAADNAEQSKAAAETASTAAVAASTAAKEAAVETAEDRNAVVTAKEAVDKVARDFDDAAQAALDDVNRAGQAWVKDVQAEGEKQLQDIMGAASHQEMSDSAAGDMIVLTDSAGGAPIRDFKLTGKTEQASTAGKNLIDIPRIDKDTADTDISCNISKNIVVSAQKVPSEISTSAWRIAFEKKDGTTERASDGNFNGKTITASEANPIVKATYRGINIVNGAYDGIQIEYGNTPTAYESYTGGRPSPNPDYPQEIVNAGKLNEETGKYEVQVKFTGKNLFDIDSIQNFYVGTINKFNGYKLHLPPGNYVLGTENKGDYDGKGEYLYAFIERENGNNSTTMYVVANTKPSSSSAVPIAIKENEILVFYDALSGRKPEASKPLFEKYDFMLNLGEKLEVYEPYKEQLVTLTSDRPITKWDRLEKREGVWGWAYKSGEITFDGSDDEKWTVDGITKAFTPHFRINVNNAKFNYSFCDKYRFLSASWVSELFAVYSDDNYEAKYFRPPYEGFENTVENWRAFLNDNPLTVKYETINEVSFTPLPQDQQDAIRALSTYYPTTVIRNDCGCDMELCYVADTKNYIDKKFDELNKALVNTQAQLL